MCLNRGKKKVIYTTLIALSQTITMATSTTLLNKMLERKVGLEYERDLDESAQESQVLIGRNNHNNPKGKTVGSSPEALLWLLRTISTTFVVATVVANNVPVKTH